MSIATSSYPLLTRLVAASVNISQKSAKILRDIKSSGHLNIQEKEANDFVTKADFQSQLNIVKSLGSLFPKLKVCGEEGDLKDDYDDLELTLSEEVLKHAANIPEQYQNIKEEDLFVWVDPLDGTKEYTQGHDVAHEVTVLIGVSWNGKPIAGVVNQPFFQKSTDTYLSRVLWSIVGLGTFDLNLGKVSMPPKVDGLTRIVTTRSHITDIVKRDLTSIPNSTLTHAGGAGYKFLAILDGKADVYLYPRDGTKRWDTCAPEALIRALDGTMVDILGNEYDYSQNELNIFENCYGLLGSSSKDNSEILKHLSEELKNQVLQSAEKLKARKVAEKETLDDHLIK